MSENSQTELHEINLPGHIGDQVGSFKVEDRIGKGGEGIVHRAIDTATGETVAIKILHHEKPDLEDIHLERKRKPWWRGGQHVVRVIPPPNP